MSEDKSSIDTLKDIAKKANWDIEVIEKQHHFRVGNNERYVIVKNPQIQDAFFISAQTINMNMYRVYSGIFYPIAGYDKYHLLIRRRNLLDKINVRNNRRRFKVGSSSFDSKIYIETNNDLQTHQLLSSAKVQMQIIEFLNYTDRLHIGVNEINPDFNKNLAGKSYLSVFMFMEWMLDKNLINKAFKIGEILNGKLILNK